MAPALLPGDYVLAVRFAPVRPGDVVAFPHPDRPDFTLVKRVVEVDGGEVVVLGDNASRSAGDSRELGPIPLPAIEARIVFRYWPLTRIGRSGLTG